jgi:hypothetical protein
LANAGNLTVHGPDGAPRPRIFFSEAPPADTNVGNGLVLKPGSVLRSVEVHNLSTASGAGAVYADDGSTIDHVIASTGGVSTLPPTPTPQLASAIVANGAATIVDTIAYATNAGPAGSNTEVGGEALNIQANGGADTVRNTTVIDAAGGTNFAMEVDGSEGSTTVTLENSIVEQGGDGLGGQGLALSASGATITVNADHDVISGATNFTFPQASYNPTSVTVGPAVFVGAAHQDYHESTASAATIDHGAAVPAGDPAFDIDGDLRTVDSAPDIGADELPSEPSAVATDASNVGTDHATVLGSVTAGGGVGRAVVEYGQTSALGSQSAASAVSAGAPQQLVTFPLTGLSPGTLYHARITVTNQAGTVSSEEITFTTDSSGGQPVTIKKLGSSTTATSSGTTFVLTLPLSVGCPSGASCTATVTIIVPAATAARKRHPRKPIVIGKARISLRPGQHLHPVIKLNRTGAKLLRRHKRLTVSS